MNYAQQEVAAFAQHLRDEALLTTVFDDLIRVVGRTLQPSSVGLWIRHTR